MGHIVLLAAVTIGVLVVGGTLLYEEIEEQRERTRRARVAASNAGQQQHETARTSTRRHDIQLRKRLVGSIGFGIMGKVLIRGQLSIYRLRKEVQTCWMTMSR